MMADDESDRMEAALAILGMANGAPSQPNAKSTPASRSSLSPFARNAHVTAHVPVPTMPRPERGAVASPYRPSAEAAAEATTTTFHSIQSAHAPKQVVLPKVPRNVFLRSRLESKIARNEAAAQNLVEKVNTPLAVRSGSEVSPRRRKKKSKRPPSHNESSIQGRSAQLFVSEGDLLQHIEPGVSEASRIDQSMILQAGETHTSNHDAATKQSIAHPSSLTHSLESSQEPFVSGSDPKIATTAHGNLSTSRPRTQYVSTSMRNKASSDNAKPLRPNLTLNIRSKAEPRMPKVPYSPISPADSHSTYTVIDTPTLRSLPNPMQSEPLDLSKDTRAATVPLMQLVSPGVMDMANLPLFNSVLPSGDGGKGLPLQYLSISNQLAVRDGKLVLVANPDMLHSDQISSPIVQSPGAIVANPGALLSNPAAYGMQLVQDKQSGHALLLPSPQVQSASSGSENPFIPRHNSYPSLSALAQLHDTQAGGDAQSGVRVSWSRTVAANVSPKYTTAASALSPSSKQTRDQSSLPPKKRKFVEQLSDHSSAKKPPTPISPKSMASNISSLTDEGYHTLKEDTVLSAAAAAGAKLARTLSRDAAASAAAGDGHSLSHAMIENAKLVMDAFKAQQFAQLAPQPRMSTGLADSLPLRNAQALLLPKPSPGNRHVAETHHPIAQSLPVNLENVESPPMTPQGGSAAAAKDSMQELYTQKLFDEYQRSLREGGDVRPGKSPFQHFRPTRVKRSNSTKVHVDLTSGYNWKSTVTARMQLDSDKTTKAEPATTGSDVSSDVKQEADAKDSSGVKVEDPNTDIKREQGPPGAQPQQRDVTPPAVDEKPSAELLEGCKKSGLTDEDGDLPIHIAVVHENLRAVEKLIYMMRVATVNIDHLNTDRQTPLHIAVITKNEAILSCLLQAGSNPNIPDRKGFTGIHLAVKHNSKKCLLAILQESMIQPDLNARNYEGYTALHMCVLNHHADFTQVLLLAGASLDIQDNKSGRTALFHAAETKQFSIACALLQKGASVNIASYAGTTAAQAANGRGHSDLVALLIKYGAEVSTNLRDSDSRPTSRSNTPSQLRGSLRSLPTSNRMLRRMGSTGDLAMHDPTIQHIKDTAQQHAHSLDMDTTAAPPEPLDTGNGKTRDLRIVLPQANGVAASMPLSPSALGLATSKRLPMIPPMQAKSLPDDVVSTADDTRTTQSESTSVTSSSSTVTSPTAASSSATSSTVAPPLTSKLPPTQRYTLSEEKLRHLKKLESKLQRSSEGVGKAAKFRDKNIESYFNSRSVSDKSTGKDSSVSFAVPTSHGLGRRSHAGDVEFAQVARKRIKTVHSSQQIKDILHQKLASPNNKLHETSIDISAHYASSENSSDSMDTSTVQIKEEEEVKQSVPLKQPTTPAPSNDKGTTDNQAKNTSENKEVSATSCEQKVKTGEPATVNNTHTEDISAAKYSKADGEITSGKTPTNKTNAIQQPPNALKSDEEHKKKVKGEISNKGNNVLDPTPGHSISAPNKDAPNKDAPNKDAPNKDAPNKDTPNKDAPSSAPAKQASDESVVDNQTSCNATQNTDVQSEAVTDRILSQRRRQFSKESSDGSVELSQSFLDSLESKNCDTVAKQADEPAENDSCFAKDECKNELSEKLPIIKNVNNADCGKPNATVTVSQGLPVV